MEIREITTPEDLKNYARLCEFAFQFEFSEEDLRRAEETQHTKVTLGVFENQSLIAGMQIIPFETYVHGTLMGMGGIGAVASWPEYRRQGYVAAMLRDGLHRMRLAKQPLSYLFPFKHSFYRRYGWELAAEEVKYSLEAAKIPKFSEVEGVVRRANEGQLDAVISAYESYISRYNGTGRRDRKYWENKMLKKGRLVYLYFSPAGEVEGYLVFQVKDQEFKIFEWVSNTHRSRQGFWNFIGQHDSMVKKVLWHSPNDRIDMSYIANPHGDFQLVTQHMARIVDVDQFFCLYPWKEVESFSSFCLQIQDEHAKWNEGLWRFDSRQGERTQVARVQSAPALPVVKCDIQSLTQLALGYCSPSQLAYLERIAASEEEIASLEKIFPQEINFSTVFF